MIQIVNSVSKKFCISYKLTFLVHSCYIFTLLDLFLILQNHIFGAVQVLSHEPRIVVKVYILIHRRLGGIYLRVILVWAQISGNIITVYFQGIQISKIFGWILQRSVYSWWDLLLRSFYFLVLHYILRLLFDWIEIILLILVLNVIRRHYCWKTVNLLGNVRWE